MPPLLPKFLTALSLLHATFLFAQDWSDQARRLTGHSHETRTQALKELRSLDGLQGILVPALETKQKYLALEVIGALSLKWAIPHLIRLADRDENGVGYLTLNSLIDTENSTQILGFYLERLRSQNRTLPSVTAQMVILDTLGRTGTLLSEQELLFLMSSAPYETRSSVLYYVRLIAKQRGKALFPNVLKVALLDKAGTIRIQALHSIKDQTFAPPDSLKGILRDCTDDSLEAVRALCSELLKRVQK